MMNRRDFVKRAGLATATLLGTVGRGAAAETQSPQPDILLFIADDMSWFDCQPYGSTVVKTPAMAGLADEGMCFDAMFTATAMCAPTRQQLYTGMFPVRNGAYPNHSWSYKGVKSIVHHLGDLGYRVGLAGKKHFGPEKSFPFEFLGGLDHDAGNQNEFDFEAISSFVRRDSRQPYCLIVASNQPHSPWNRTVEGVDYAPDNITVPPYLVDCPEVHDSLCRYYEEITYADRQLGRCLAIVDQAGRRDNTLVMFTSEQGSQFPFGKWTCYDTGLKTAFIARWPGRIKPGSRNRAMTQYVDVVPTLVDAAGGKSTACKTGRKDAAGNSGFDGRSFLAVLQGKTQHHRDYVYGVQTTRGIIRGSECYPIRSVRSERYKYIRNLNYQAAFENVLTGGKLLKTWEAMGSENPAFAERARFYQHRPEEELYDLTNDPWELTNLAGDEKLAEVKAELRKALETWMAQQGDAGIETEMKALKRQAKQGEGE